MRAIWAPSAPSARSPSTPRSRNTPLSPDAEADIHLLRFTEHLLASAIGAASSRLVLSLLLRRGDAGSQSALRLLDDASEALQYNRDLLQSALDQVRHGLSVFDKDMRLICWNRQFRELLNLPPELGRVGAPLDRILRTCAERGDFGAGDVDKLVADRLMKLAVTQETFQEQFDGGRRILEIPHQSDAAGRHRDDLFRHHRARRRSEALARANETLERRVRERTAELLEVNQALAVAKRKADEANLDKTRFLAAASHDVLQPLNAARLYVTSLVERQLGGPKPTLARNIDASLDAVEEILNVLIEISRLDAGRLEPDISGVPAERAVRAAQSRVRAAGARKGPGPARRADARCGCAPTGGCCAACCRTSLSNAIKYTASGQGAARRAPARRPTVSVQVCDTGPGIPKVQAHADLQGIPSAGGDGELGQGARARPFDRRAHRQGARAIPSACARCLGSGSTFSVDLPRGASSARVETCRAVAPSAAASPGLTALCIDNEPAVLERHAGAADRLGLHVLTAQSAAEA